STIYNVIHHRAGHTTELVSHNTNTEFLTITTTTTHHHLMADISREERLQLALQAYKKGQFPSIQKAADAFDVPKSTLITRVSGTTSRKDSIANCRKLTETEENTLSTWILDMD
ncbi:Transposase Tan1, partial [Rasamsonia emersonii CBS 393.64]